MKILSVKNAKISIETYTLGDGRQIDRWLVRLGTKFTGCKAQRKMFDDYEEARDWLLAEVDKKKARGFDAYCERRLRNQDALAWLSLY